MKMLVSLLVGALFGAGLTLSTMADPRRVLDFLDVTGTWDPTLVLVMGGALLVAAPGFWLVRRQKKPALDTTFHLPTSNKIDPRLLAGAALFGIGWGFVGICPGPAFVGLAIAPLAVLPFFVAMIAGSLIYEKAF